MILKAQIEGSAAVEISDSPKIEDVARAISENDWSKPGAVTLEKDDDNWFEGTVSAGGEFAMVLSVDRLEFVPMWDMKTAEEMLPLFEAYLQGDDTQLYALIYEAEKKGLSADQVEALRQEEIDEQA